jgi:hypothetical protein
LRRAVALPVDEARRSLIAYTIESYLGLDEREAEEYGRELALPELEEVREMINIYEQRGIEKGIVAGKRDTLLRLMGRKFGQVPADVRNRILEMTDEAELDRLTDVVLDAKSIDDMGIGRS